MIVIEFFVSFSKKLKADNHQMHLMYVDSYKSEGYGKTDFKIHFGNHLFIDV